MTKQELLDAVWPDVMVTEASLSQAVHDVRRALGDEAGQVLRTVSRRGFLLCPTEPAADAEEDATFSFVGVDVPAVRRPLAAARACACIWWCLDLPAAASATILLRRDSEHKTQDSRHVSMDECVPLELPSLLVCLVWDRRFEDRAHEQQALKQRSM